MPDSVGLRDACIPPNWFIKAARLRPFLGPVLSGPRFALTANIDRVRSPDRLSRGDCRPGRKGTTTQIGGSMPALVGIMGAMTSVVRHPGVGTQRRKARPGDTRTRL